MKIPGAGSEKNWEKYHYPPIDLNKYQIPEDVLGYISSRLVRTYGVIPISKMENVLTVAIADPADIFLIDSLNFVTQLEISPALALPEQIANAIDKYYPVNTAAGLSEEIELEKIGVELSSFKESKFDLEEIEKLSQGTNVINTVNEILINAVRSRASDIHVEHFEKDVRIRYRVDGILQDVKRIEKDYREAVIARLKIMARLDITQRRLPQDGRFGFSAQEKDIDVRVSILPTDFGEKIVLRLLDKSSLNLDIEGMGFSSYALAAFIKAISQPFGMILLTGPTGSGKTTTLYAMLNRLNTIEKNIVTIEDPVEYNLAGITQIPVRHEIDLDFAVILRAILRQSPDIIMVGEMRDPETVDVAMKAALTGHIVFSTLHTNDALSSITRLLNMDVEPFLISSSLNMVAAQRLVRRICPHCKLSYSCDLSFLEDVPGEYRKKDTVLYKGGGCGECNNTGYRGRVAVVETLSLDVQLKDMIMKRASTETLREYAQVNCGMKTLRDDAFQKCWAGETTLEEVLRVTV